MILLIGRADGGVSVMQLAEGQDKDVSLAKWAAVADPAWLPVVSVTEMDEPPAMPSRRWRNAWGLEGGEVKVKLPKARELRRQEILAKRDELLLVADRSVKIAKAKKDKAAQDKAEAREGALLLLDETIDARLAAVADLAALDAWEPEEFHE